MKRIVQNLSLDTIRASNFNPRKTFKKDSLLELAKSIKELGLLQPIMVYKLNDHYRILLGERRWRAAKIAKLSEIPCIIYTGKADKVSLIEISLTENMQRDDVDVLEEAFAIKELIDKECVHPRVIAKDLGVSSSYIYSRYLLVKHKDVIEAYERSEKISFSAAKEIARLDSRPARQILIKRLETGYYSSFAYFMSEAKRYAKIEKIIQGKNSELGVISRDKMTLYITGLPQCHADECDHFLRITWLEKQIFDCTEEKPGWTDLCIDAQGRCYQKKVEHKHKQDLKKERYDKSKPIFSDRWESMAWLKVRGRYCRDCKYHYEVCWKHTSDLKELNGGYRAYCLSRSSTCYTGLKKRFESESKKRMNYLEAAWNGSESNARLESVLANLDSGRKIMTKKEVIYLLCTMFELAQSEELIDNYLASKGLVISTLPKNQNQKRDLLKKIIDTTYNDKQLVDMLFKQGARLLAGINNLESIRAFDRVNQKEVNIDA